MDYTIRYRAYRPDGRTALILEDTAGRAYLYCAGTLHCALGGTRAAERLSALLSAVLWRPVPPVAPYRLSELVALVSPAASRSAAQLAA